MIEKLSRQIIQDSMRAKMHGESLIEELVALETTLELGDARAVDFGPAKLSLKKLCGLLDSMLKNEQRALDTRALSVRYNEALELGDDATF